MSTCTILFFSFFRKRRKVRIDSSNSLIRSDAKIDGSVSSSVFSFLSATELRVEMRSKMTHQTQIWNESIKYEIKQQSSAKL
jgi:hypothetical protein